VALFIKIILTMSCFPVEVLGQSGIIAIICGCTRSICASNGWLPCSSVFVAVGIT